MNKDTQEIQMTQSQNPNIKLEVDDKVLNLLKDYRINKIKKEISIQNSLNQKVAEIRQSNNQITIDLLKKSIPDIDNKIHDIHNSNAELLNLADRLSKDYFNNNPPFLFHTEPEPTTNAAPASGEFFWAETNPFITDERLGIEFLSDGAHFFGRIPYNDDPLIQRNFGIIATFVLDPSRRPPAPNGRFASFPFVDLFGTIGGWTGLHHWMWAADDKWCKCFLHLRQTAFQVLPGRVVVLAERNDHKTLIDEENNGRSVNHGLPGFQPMPDIQFGLADPNLPVLVDLEIRFDIKLEGNSFIAFSPEQNPQNSVLVITRQWKVQPL